MNNMNALNAKRYSGGKTARLFLGIFMCAALPLFLTRDASFAGTPKLVRSAPAFEVRTLEGKRFGLREARGRPVVINFWASWCTPCRTEAQGIQRAYAAFKGAGVRFIGIAVDDEPKNARRFIKEFNWSFPVSLDAADEMIRAYNVYGVPKTVVVNGDGLITHEHLGPISEETLTQEIKNALPR